MTVRRAMTPLLPVVLAVSLLAGCGGSSSSPPTAGGSSSPTAPTSSASTSPSPSASSTPSGPFGAVAPATGPRLKLSTFTVRAPRGWQVDRSFGSHVVFADKDAAEIEFSDLSFPDVSLEAMAKVARDGGHWPRKPRILPPVTIDGTEFYRLSGDVGGGMHVEEFGAVTRLRRMKLSFELDQSAAVARKLVGSVLATFRLR